jgi:two-component system chemotaxis response regulator CheY
MDTKPTEIKKSISYFRYRVLVVEDDTLGAKLITLVLHKLGFEDIELTQNGEDAWNLIENATQPFDLVISDWNMPHMTGLELLQKVRKTNSHLPFIMITGRGMLESAVDAKTHGVTHFIYKPYTPHQLIEKIHKTFKEE